MASTYHLSFLLSLKSTTSKASPSFLRTTFAKSKTRPPSHMNLTFASLNESNSNDGDQPSPPDPVKVAFSKAMEYKKSKQLNSNPVEIKTRVTKEPMQVEKRSVTSGSSSSQDSGGELPASVKLAMEKAREYKKNKGVAGEKGLESTVGKLKNNAVKKTVDKKEELTISNIDFVGLDFSEKKTTKRTPAGLVPSVDPFVDGDLPEVEFIVGDTSKFGSKTSSQPVPLQEDDDSDVYEPKVSTWGVFPRPSNISKTYGGGRVIQPGEVLETAENKAEKQARTRKLLAAFKNKMGLTIDPKIKSECEKALKDGDRLMDLGKLQEALPYYEKVMEKVVFQSELHGMAALQWSICQDSLSRPNEARVMYEKLQSHPNVQVSKRARQFMFSFQAMEMMKVSSFSRPTTGYQSYFEAFVEKSDYPLTQDENEDSLKEVLPYIAFLVSPILIILLVAARKVF